MRSFTFAVPIESGLTARYQESATATGERSTIAESLISALPLDGAGKPLWAIEAADPTIYGWLSFVRVTGGAEVSGDSRLLAPHSADPDLCNVTVRVRTLTGAVAPGIVITASPTSLPAMTGESLLSTTTTSETTDAAGIAVLPLMKGATYTLTGLPLGSGRNVTITDESLLTLEAFIG